MEKEQGDTPRQVKNLNKMIIKASNRYIFFLRSKKKLISLNHTIIIILYYYICENMYILFED